MKIKVREASGPVLDWMVRIARGDEVTLDEDQWICVDGMADMPLSAYNPSTDWSQGGPIVEREITLLANNVASECQATKIQGPRLGPPTAPHL